MNTFEKVLVGCICLALLSTAPVFAQSAANPLVTGQNGLYSMVKNNVVRSAEKMPEENFSFKPTPEVRSFGQILGHVADSQYAFCSAVLGETNPRPNVEKSKTAKADLVAALNEAFAYCDKAYASLTDAQAAEMVKFFGREQPKLTVLSFSTMHDDEHYGNLVTYMRIKGLVPPSSEPRR